MESNSHESLTVTVDIYVDASYMFTATLSPEDAVLIKGYGVELKTNGRRNGREGYFASQTKEGLIQDIRGILKECLSKEVIKTEYVLRYAIWTACSFGFTTDDKIIPNMGWRHDGEPDKARGWQHGTELTHAANRHPSGILFYARPYVKETIRYRKGNKVEYHETSAFSARKVTPDNYYLRWLEATCSTDKPKNATLREIPCTEKNAKFFVEMYKAICRLAHTLAQFGDPEAMLDLIESGGPSLLEGKFPE